MTDPTDGGYCEDFEWQLSDQSPGQDWQLWEAPAESSPDLSGLYAFLALLALVFVCFLGVAIYKFGCWLAVKYRGVSVVAAASPSASPPATITYENEK